MKSFILITAGGIAWVTASAAGIMLASWLHGEDVWGWVFK